MLQTLKERATARICTYSSWRKAESDIVRMRSATISAHNDGSRAVLAFLFAYRDERTLCIHA